MAVDTTAGPRGGCDPIVAVYRSAFLPRSETFVRDHLVRMPRYRTVALTDHLMSDRLEVPGHDPLTVRATTPRRRALAAVLRRGGRQRPAHDLALEDTLGRSRADLVHAHFGVDGAAVLTAARRRRLPLVVTFHGYDATTRHDVLREDAAGAWLVEHWHDLLASADAVVTVSQYMREVLLRKGARAETLHVIGCGVDAHAVEVVPPPEQPRLVFVGRLVEKKGVGDLLEALSGLDAAPALDVVGDGPLRSALEARAEELRLPVTFHGVRSSEQVRQHLAAASVVVMPSKRSASGDSEGLGVTALEAAAAGRPLVGYRHGGLAEAVEHGVSGLLAEEGDIAGLREHLRALLSDRDARERLGVRARRRVEETFDADTLLTRLAGVYDDVLRMSSRAGAGASGRRPA